jgi:hypothetical protein
VNAMRRTCLLCVAVLLAVATAATVEAAAPHLKEDTRDVGVIDTLPLRTEPVEMTARCRDMETALRDCGRNDRAVAALQRNVRHEKEELRAILPPLATPIIHGPCLGLLLGVVGFWAGNTIYPKVLTSGASWPVGCPVGAVVGCPVGCAVGYLGGVAISKWRRVGLITEHRAAVNSLVRRANRAFWSRHDPN